MKSFFFKLIECKAIFILCKYLFKKFILYSFISIINCSLAIVNLLRENPPNSHQTGGVNGHHQCMACSLYFPPCVNAHLA